MKYWKCPYCMWVKETPEDIVFVACNCCLTEMKEVKNDKQTRDTK